MGVSLKQISQMSYNQLAYGVSVGEISITDLRIYYSSARKRALERNKRITKTTEFGEIEKVSFEKLRNLKTIDALIHEIHDVNKYLSKKSSTITGLKEIRSWQIELWKKHGFTFVDESNYARFSDFIKWFQNSEYLKYFDSDDEEVGNIFIQAGENASPEDWEKLFNEYVTQLEKGKNY